MKLTEAQQIVKNLTFDEKIKLLNMLSKTPSIKNKIEITTGENIMSSLVKQRKKLSSKAIASIFLAITAIAAITLGAVTIFAFNITFIYC